jgi:DNA-binding transcriptional MerR regulator
MTATSIEERKHKIYYTIGEVSQYIGVSSSLIRFWGKELNIKPKNKDEKGNRKYKKSDIEKLKLIKKMIKEEGYTLRGVRTNLVNSTSENKKKAEIIDRLTELKGLLIYVRDLL